MYITYEAKSYSKGRVTVMGISTLLIIWFHSSISVPTNSLLWLQKYTCDVGVDMFLFASGVGAFFSMKKYKRVFQYYINRIQRVVIPFLIVAIPWFAYHDIVIGHSRRLFAKDVLMLTFWTEGRMTFWFIAAILVLYGLTPGYMALKKKYRHLGVAIMGVIYGAMFFAPMEVLGSLVGPAMIFLPRIPVYLMGISFGAAIEEKRVFRIHVGVPIGVLAACFAVAALAMEYCQWTVPFEFKYLAFGPAAVILSCACACIPTNKLLNFFGKRSLEIYLLLEKVQVTLSIPKMEPLTCGYGIPYFAVCFAITLILVELLRCIAYPFQRPIRWKQT